MEPILHMTLVVDFEVIIDCELAPPTLSDRYSLPSSYTHSTDLMFMLVPAVAGSPFQGLCQSCFLQFMKLIYF